MTAVTTCKAAECSEPVTLVTLSKGGRVRYRDFALCKKHVRAAELLGYEVKR